MMAAAASTTSSTTTSAMPRSFSITRCVRIQISSFGPLRNVDLEALDATRRQRRTVLRRQPVDVCAPGNQVPLGVHVIGLPRRRDAEVRIAERQLRVEAPPDHIPLHVLFSAL